MAVWRGTIQNNDPDSCQYLDFFRIFFLISLEMTAILKPIQERGEIIWIHC